MTPEERGKLLALLTGGAAPAPQPPADEGKPAKGKRGKGKGE
jgi:hypothetical protein